MKTVGILGGTGPESTIVYYRSIVAAYREQKQDDSYPSIVINSIDLTKMLGVDPVKWTVAGVGYHRS